MPEPFIPTPNTALVELRYTLNAQHVENTLWFEFNSDPNVDDLSALAEAMYNWWHDFLSDQQSTDVKFVEAVATSQTSESSPIASFAPATAATGSIATEAMPGNVSLAVSFRTASRGRSFRGRNYMVGIPRSVVTADHVSDAYAADCAAKYADLLPSGSSTPTGWIWVVTSHRHNNAPRVEGVTSGIISVLTVDTTIDSQRRRLTGRGA